MVVYSFALFGRRVLFKVREAFKQSDRLGTTLLTKGINLVTMILIIDFLYLLFKVTKTS